MQDNRLIHLPINNKIEKGVDQKKTFGMDSFELSVLETVEQATITQSFSEPIFYNLIKGKKVMRFQNEKPFDYLPGNTMIVPPHLQMEVHFPDSSLTSPTECLSLTIDRAKIARSLSLLNERYPRLDGQTWYLSMKNHSLLYNQEITQLIFKLYYLAQKNTQESRIIAELTLTELLVLLFQNQNLNKIDAGHTNHNSVLNDVIRFIQDNLELDLSIDFLSKKASMSKTSLYRSFKREFNISPIDFVNKSRVDLAKKIMTQHLEMSISEVGYAVGFGNPNYFSKIFKQYAHLSPSEFKRSN